MHVPLKRVVRIRHYGLLSSRNKNRKITLCRNLLDCQKYLSRLKDLDAPAIIRLLYNKDVCKCSSCGGKIIPVGADPSLLRSEPHMLCWYLEAEYGSCEAFQRLISDAIIVVFSYKTVHLSEDPCYTLDRSGLIENPYIPAIRTRFVQPGKIEIDANERAAIGKRNAAFSFAPSSILSLTICASLLIAHIKYYYESIHR